MRQRRLEPALGLRSERPPRAARRAARRARARRRATSSVGTATDPSFAVLGAISIVGSTTGRRAPADGQGDSNALAESPSEELRDTSAQPMPTKAGPTSEVSTWMSRFMTRRYRLRYPFSCATYSFCRASSRWPAVNGSCRRDRPRSAAGPTLVHQAKPCHASARADVSRISRNQTPRPWGGQASNLRPTDYESVIARPVAFRDVC